MVTENKDIMPAKNKKKEFVVEPIPSKGGKFKQLEKYVTPPLPGSNGRSFVVSLLGPRGSGKSVFGVRVIQNCYRKAFDEVVIFSPNLYNDDNFREIMGYRNVYGSTHVDNDILDKLIEEQNRRMQSERAGMGICPVVLIWFDDEGGKLKSKELKRTISHLFTQGRHAKFCIMVSIQSLLQYEGILLSNTTSWVCWSLEKRSLDKVAKECATNLMDTKAMTKFINHATSQEPHSFAMIHNAGLPSDRCFVHTSKGFERYIQPDATEHK
jgi:Poxvirus A32 protein